MGRPALARDAVEENDPGGRVNCGENSGRTHPMFENSIQVVSR